MPNNIGKKTYKKTICIDIDGTVCSQTQGDYENAKPFQKALDIVNCLYDEGFEIVFFTARFMGRYKGDLEKVYQQGYDFTFNQLKEWGVKFHKLYLGKPSHHILVDDKALFFNPNWEDIYNAIKAKESEFIR